MTHHPRCPCEECERGSMLAVAVIGTLLTLAIALVFWRLRQ